MHVHDIAEEYALKNSLEATYTVGLYLDDPTEGGDDLADSDDLAAISTEPTAAPNYARVSDTISYEIVGGDAASTNDSEIAFDLTDNTQTLDSYFVVVTFQSVRAGDGSAQDHLLGTQSLGRTFDGGRYGTLRLDPGRIGVSID